MPLGNIGISECVTVQIVQSDRYERLIDDRPIHILRDPTLLIRLPLSLPRFAWSRRSRAATLRSPFHVPWKRSFEFTHACIAPHRTAPSSQQSHWVSEPSTAAAAKRFADGYLMCCGRKSTIVDDVGSTGRAGAIVVSGISDFDSRRDSICSLSEASSIHGSRKLRDRRRSVRAYFCYRARCSATCEDNPATPLIHYYWSSDNHGQRSMHDRLTSVVYVIVRIGRFCYPPN